MDKCTQAYMLGLIVCSPAATVIPAPIAYIEAVVLVQF